MKRDYVITFLTEFLVSLSALIVYKLANNLLGRDGFSEYALTRRIIAFIQPILLLGFSIGIPRYIAYNRATSGEAKSNTYFIAGLSSSVLVLFIFIPLLNLFKNKFAFLCFGSASYYYLIFPISLMVIGLVLNVFCYSYFRGKLMMNRANFLQIINLGIMPLLAFGIFKNTIYQVLIGTGLLWIITSLVFLISILIKIRICDKDIIPCVKELLIYGIQRVPGDFGLAALLGLPAIIVAHIAGVKEAGYMAFGISIIGMAGSVFSPLGLVLLPETSQMIAGKKFGSLKSYITKILTVSLGLTILGLVVFEIFAPQIIKIYLGNAFSDLVLIGRIVLFASLGYTVYITMRSILDAYYIKALNTKNIFISLLIFLILAGLILFSKRSYIYLSVSFVLAILILGVLTLQEIKRIFQREN